MILFFLAALAAAWALGMAGVLFLDDADIRSHRKSALLLATLALPVLAVGTTGFLVLYVASFF